MDPQLLNHLLQLAAKTGDRLIVVDPASQRPFVLMGIAQYEELVVANDRAERSEPRSMVPTAMTMPDPVVQRANAELAAWRASQPAPIVPTELDRTSVRSMPQSVVMGSGFSPEPLQSAAVDDDRFYVEPLE